jgi:putative peptidoglycan lipid II flippase
MSIKLFRSTFLVSILTGISRILGLIREIVFATLFGATSGMDAFLVAFKIPNFLRRLFAEGAFSQAFVPILGEYKERQSPEDFALLIRRVSGSLALVVFLVSMLGSLTSAVWISVFAPGFYHQADKFNWASEMLRITFPYLFFISLTALSGSVLNTLGKFAIPAITPVILNIVLIFGAVFLRDYFDLPIMALAWSVLLAGILQFLFQLPFLWKMGILQWPQIAFRDPGVRRVLRLMVPALYGASVAQISLLFDSVFASFLKTGSVSWLYYSDRLMQFPLGVFGVALSTVVLPHLSRRVAAQDHEGYEKGLAFGLRWVFLIGLPASMGLVVLAKPLVQSFLNYGAFNQEDVLMTSRSLMAFGFGVVCFMAVKVLVTAFYSRQDIKTPVKIATLSVGVNIILNALLMWPLGHVGIALATTIAAMVNMLFLWGMLMKKLNLKISPEGLKDAFKMAISVSFMGLVLILALWLIQHYSGEVFATHAAISHEKISIFHRTLNLVSGRMGYLFGLLSLGFLSYLGMLWCMKFDFKKLF